MNNTTEDIRKKIEPLERKAMPFFHDLKDTALAYKSFQHWPLYKKAYGVLIALFVIALWPFLPYEFYITLRVVACACLIIFFLPLKDSDNEKAKLNKLILAGLILLYNPLFPVHLGFHLLWAIINLATLYFLYLLKTSFENTADIEGEIVVTAETSSEPTVKDKPKAKKAPQAKPPKDKAGE